MTMPHGSRTPHRPAATRKNDQGRQGRHGWMMIACCVPMLAIAIVLVVTGVIGVSWLLVAIACTLMMGMMMGGHGRT